MSSFPNTTEARIPCVNNHWIRTRWYRGWRGVISLQLNLNSATKTGTKTTYRMLISSNWSCLWWWLFGYFIRRAWVWSSSIRDCVLDTMTHENTWRDGIRYFMTTNLNACATLQNQGRDYQNIEILCWMFFNEHKALHFVHHIVWSISQYQYVDSYIWPSFIEILGRDWKVGKASMGKVE